MHNMVLCTGLILKWMIKSSGFNTNEIPGWLKCGNYACNTSRNAFQTLTNIQTTQTILEILNMFCSSISWFLNTIIAKAWKVAIKRDAKKYLVILSNEESKGGNDNHLL